MRKKNYKGRCEKRTINKSEEVLKLYDELQIAYVDILEKNDDVTEIRCNIFLEGFSEGDYVTDFLCVKSDGDLMVRECVSRKYLIKPMTVRLLDASKKYWQTRGVIDWGIVTDAEK